MIPIIVAHISKDGAYQPLEEHLRLTSEWCSLFTQKVGLSRVGSLIGYLHDMGKTGQLFQTYIRYNHLHPEDTSLRGTIPHSTQGAKYIYERYCSHSFATNLTASVVALTIACHHGGLMDCVSPEGDLPLNERLSGEDPKLCYEEILRQFPQECPAFTELDELFCAASQEIQAFTEKSKAQGLGSPFVFHMMVRLLFSCLIDSDRYDSYCFEAGLTGQISELAVSPWEELSSRLERHLSGFDATKPINKLRGEISQHCKEAAQKPCGIYKLSVPTGGGKTLSSLRFALEHARLHGKERIFYIIPFTTIIDQNAKEIRNILHRDDLILEHHSNVIADRRHGDVGDDEEDGEYKLLTERWNSPIILTTMVQFLNSLYAGGTRAVRRMHSLANAVLIFDEIQAAPVNCIHLLTGALNFLSRLCGSTVVLCTATQPELSEVLRPLYLSEGSQLVDNLDEVFRGFRRTHVVDARVDGGYSVAGLRQFMAEKLEGLRTGLAIFNTKREAVCFYQEICQWNNGLPPEERYCIYYLSTSLCPAHRKKILDTILSQLSNGRVICVSTQLIEAGVDISFQCVIRALAGLDSVAQAAGRCNRHKEYNGCRDVFVVNVTGENLAHLPDILAGQQAAEGILNMMSGDQNLYDGDPISPAAIRAYYLNYYKYVQNKMDYPVTKVSPNATLVDLLGKNTIGCGELELRGIPKPPLWQAFGTAGEHFKAIENDTTAVIVPYGEGKSLIEQLRKGDLDIKERAALLQKAQQYSVNVFSHEKKLLDRENAIEVLPGDILVLDERFYNDDAGITTDGKPMKAQII